MLAYAPRRAHPLSPVIFMKLVELFFNFQDPYEATMWSVMILEFLMFARISNLLPESSSVFDPSKQLTRQDVRVAENAVVLVVKWTKTIKHKRKLVLPLHVTPNSQLCPKLSLLRSVRLSPGTLQDDLFSCGPQLKLLSHQEFTKFLRKNLSLAGFNSTSFSGHSLRRGGATWALSQAIPTGLIQTHGDWASDTYMAYQDFSLNNRLKTTAIMLSQ